MHNHAVVSEVHEGLPRLRFTTSRTVYFDLSCVWLEALGRILRSDLELDRRVACRDCLLSQTKLRKGCTDNNLNLSRNNVGTTISSACS